MTITGPMPGALFQLGPPTLNTTGPEMHLCYCKALWFQVIAVWLSPLPLKPHYVPQLDWIPPGFNSWLILAGFLPFKWRTKYNRLSWVSGLSILIMRWRATLSEPCSEEKLNSQMIRSVCVLKPLWVMMPDTGVNYFVPMLNSFIVALN